jgi:hypothetical protein
MDEWSKDSSEVISRNKLSGLGALSKRTVSRTSIPEPIEEANEDDREAVRIVKGLKKRIQKKSRLLRMHLPNQPRPRNKPKPA